jgi:hypothetical protein
MDLTVDAGAWQEAAGEPLTRVSMAKVGLLDTGHNEWHSPWSSGFQGWTGLFADVATATRAAQSFPRSGTTFCVSEVPALVLHGSSRALVLVDAHPDNPFFGWTSRSGSTVDALVAGMPLSAVRAAFEPWSKHWLGEQPSPHSVRSGLVPGSGVLQPLAADEPLQTFVSMVRGPGLPLRWLEIDNRYSRSGVQRILQRFNGVSDGVPAAGPAAAGNRIAAANRSAAASWSAAAAGARRSVLQVLDKA